MLQRIKKEGFEFSLASLPKEKCVSAKAILLFYMIPALSSHLILFSPFLSKVY